MTPGFHTMASHIPQALESHSLRELPSPRILPLLSFSATTTRLCHPFRSVHYYFFTTQNSDCCRARILSTCVLESSLTAMAWVNQYAHLNSQQLRLRES